jgi:carbonic anhydrase
MTPEQPPTAIVTCMDARLDAAGFLDLWPEAVHVARSAGGRVTADVLRSIAASYALGTRRFLVIHHTDCAMAKHTDAEIRERLPAGADPDVEFGTIADPIEALREDLLAIERSSLLPADIEVAGLIYDLDARVARPLPTTTAD